MTEAENIAWIEYDYAAMWCAKRSIKGQVGDRLPFALSQRCLDLIEADHEAFQKRIRATSYMLAMEKAPA